MSNEKNDSRLALLERDIEELQSRLEFQAHTIEALDKVIAEQERRLSLQETQLHMLAQRFKGMESRLDDYQGDEADERPPHY